VAATPSSDSGLSYATEPTPPAQVKEESMDDNPNPLLREHPYSSPGPQTPWPEGQANSQSVGSAEHTTLRDINPPTWGQIREGGDTMAQKFTADMYKFMYITNRTMINASSSYDNFEKTNAELVNMVKATREEAAEAHREVLRLSGGMAAMQKTISSMSEEIKLITRRAHEPSPPLKTSSTLTTRTLPSIPTLPPKPKSTQRIDDQNDPGNNHPTRNTKPTPTSNINTDQDDEFGGPSNSQIRSADAEMFDADAYAEAPMPERGWNKVAGKGAKKNAKGTVHLTNTTPAKPAPTTKTITLDDSQLWILRFNGNPPARRMSPAQMYLAVNSVDKGDWPFDVVTAHWSQGGNGNSIMLRFTARTTKRAIDIHHACHRATPLAHMSCLSAIYTKGSL